MVHPGTNDDGLESDGATQEVGGGKALTVSGGNQGGGGGYQGGSSGNQGGGFYQAPNPGGYRAPAGGGFQSPPVGGNAGGGGYQGGGSQGGGNFPGGGNFQGGSTAAKGFFASLFDFSFSSFITPSLVKILYGLIIALTALFCLALVIASFARNPIVGLLTLLIVAPLIFLFYVIISRVYLELVMLLFKIEEHTAEMAAQARTRRVP